MKVIFSDGDNEVLEGWAIWGKRFYLRYDTGSLAGTVRTDRISARDARRVEAGEAPDVIMELKNRLGW